MEESGNVEGSLEGEVEGQREVENNERRISFSFTSFIFWSLILNHLTSRCFLRTARIGIPFTHLEISRIWFDWLGDRYGFKPALHSTSKISPSLIAIRSTGLDPAHRNTTYPKLLTQ